MRFPVVGPRRWLADRRRLSPELRRKRRIRALLGAMFGMVWSASLVFLIAQFGVLSFINYGALPWWGGILLGMVASVLLAVLRPVFRSLRIKLATTRSSGLVAALLFATILLGAHPVAAQGLQECDVLVSGQGIDEPRAMSTTSAGDPLVVDLDQAGVFTVRWGLPPGADVDGKTWRFEAEVAGFSRQIYEAVGEADDDGVYRLEGLGTGIVPGRYPVRGVFEGVCPAQTGYVRVVGSPLRTVAGWLAIAGVGVGAAGVAVLLVRGQTRLWSFTTADGTSVEIIDPLTNSVVSEPLVRGGGYLARVTIEFPDPPADYGTMPGPVEASVGILGTGAGAWSSATMMPGGQQSVDIPVRMPDASTGLQLHTDVMVRGNLVQSIRIDETATGRLSVIEAAGHLAYRSGDFTARELCAIRPVDAALVFHGQTDGSSVELRGLRGDGSGRQFASARLGTSDVAKMATVGRQQLQAALEGWNESDDAGRRSAISAGLLDAGIELRHELLGRVASLAATDGSVLVAFDSAATGAMTLPLSLPADPVGGETGRRSSLGHCPDAFWGLRYEFAWPNGRAPRQDDPAPGLLRNAFARWPFGRGGERRPISAVLDNRIPLELVHLVDPELERVDGLHHEIDRYGGQIRHHPVSGWSEFERRFEALAPETDILVILAHGGSGPGGVGQRVGPGGNRPDYGLLLGGQFVTGDQLRELGRRARFERGPLVIVNACRSGDLGWQGIDLLDALHELGARGVVVTETKVLQHDASRITQLLLASVFGGAHVSRALVEARRADFGAAGSLAGLAHTYYGPPGLRLRHPLRRDGS